MLVAIGGGGMLVSVGGGDVLVSMGGGGAVGVLPASWFTAAGHGQTSNPLRMNK